jgi:predicted transposase YbfD/YdcC
MGKRRDRRHLGILKRRLPELRLDEVRDPRKARGKRWSLAAVLKTCLAGLVSGCRSLLQVEALSQEMGPGSRHLLGLDRRLADTTMRDALVRVSPSELRKCLHRQVKAARHRKALDPEGLPFGVVAIDGKSVTLDAWDKRYAQRHRDADHQNARGLLRTLTCCLTSSSSKVCIDAVPIPATTSEMGCFARAFRGLCSAFGRGLFQLASMDAGMCSLDNATLVVDYGKDYLFGCKQDQPTLLREAQRLLAHQDKPLAETVDIRGNKEVRRCLYLSGDMAGYLNWSHLQTVLRVQSEEVDQRTGEVHTESRYFISSLQPDALTPEQWLSVIRGHWAVENQCHWTWDAVFREDERPWIRNDPQGALVVMLLRRMSFNMLALFRSVTQRSAERRQIPWRDLLRRMYNAAICSQLLDVKSLRARPAVGI